MFPLYPYPTALLPNYFKALVDTESFHPVVSANIQSVFTLLLTYFFNSVYLYHDPKQAHTLVHRSLKSFLTCPLFLIFFLQFIFEETESFESSICQSLEFGSSVCFAAPRWYLADSAVAVDFL